MGVPRHRTATFAPEGLSHLTRAELPGEVERLSMRDGFDEYDAFTRRLLTERHGFSVFDDVRTAEFRDDKLWVAVARVDGEVVGAVRYRVDRFGGDLSRQDLLTTGPLGRALLLQFFARHVDQVGRVVLTIGTDEVPDLWGTDMAVTTEGRVAYPQQWRADGPDSGHGGARPALRSGAGARHRRDRRRRADRRHLSAGRARTGG